MTHFEFDWDAVKAASSLAKHGVDFRQAAAVFFDPLALTVYDAAHSENEDRWFTLGLLREGRLPAVSHTFAQQDAGSARIRIISARAATRAERRSYEGTPR